MYFSGLKSLVQFLEQHSEHPTAGEKFNTELVENNWADIMGSFGGPDMPHIRALRQYRKLAWKKGGGGAKWKDGKGGSARFPRN
jgi:hypothetical protein